MRDIADYEQHYAQQPFERYLERYRRKMVKGLLEKYVEEGGAVLEIGCGIKPLFCDYKDQYHFTVVEPSDRFYRNAQELAKDYHNAVCVHGLFENKIETLKEKNYHMIICSALLHEVEEPQMFLQNIKLLCGRSTIVHINVPNALSLHRLLAKEMGIVRDVHQLSDTNRKFQQHSVFDLETLKTLVCEAGYDVLDEGSYFIKPFTHQQMQECIDYDILNDKILDALDGLCQSHLRKYGAEIYLNLQRKQIGGGE